MDTGLTRVVAALAELSDTELRALITATYGVPPTAPGLLAWLDSACDGNSTVAVGSTICYCRPKPRLT